MKYQGLREIRKVTEYRDSDGEKSIFKTKHVGYAWVRIDIPCYQPNEFDEFFASVSTSVMKQLNHKLNRHVNDDAPDMTIVDINKLNYGLQESK